MTDIKFPSTDPAHWYRPHWADCPNTDDFRTRK